MQSSVLVSPSQYHLVSIKCIFLSCSLTKNNIALGHHKWLGIWKILNLNWLLEQVEHLFHVDKVFLEKKNKQRLE